MLTLDELRVRYESMPIDGLLDLWSRTGRTPVVESLLRSVLAARGVPVTQLDDVAGARVSPVLNQRAPFANRRPPGTGGSGRDPSTTTEQYRMAFVVFALVLCTELTLAWQALPTIDGKAFHDFMLISMGLGFVPFFLALGAIAVAVVFFALVAWLAARLFLVLLRRE